VDEREKGAGEFDLLDWDFFRAEYFMHTLSFGLKEEVMEIIF
jgi:hypothetical protein